MVRDICLVALGANVVLFALGTLIGMTQMMWLALGSGLLCALGMKLKKITKEEE